MVFMAKVGIKSGLNGSRHTSVDPSAPTILRPRVQIPCMTSTLLFIQFKIELWCGKDNNKQEEAGIVTYLKKVKSGALALFTHSVFEPMTSQLSYLEVDVRGQPRPHSFELILSNKRSTAKWMCKSFKFCTAVRKPPQKTCYYFLLFAWYSAVGIFMQIWWP